MRIGYFTNLYPKVSHSFIRREILALERQGIDIARVAIRGWEELLVDAADIAERERTHYLLRRGLAGLVPACLGQLLQRPLAAIRTLATAIRLSRRSDKPLPYHLIYWAEACALVAWSRKARIDRLHVHFGTNPAEVAMLARMLGGPRYSFTVHGPEEFDHPVGLHLREKAAAAEQVVAISSYGRSQLYRWLDFTDWPKVQVVHCGLDAAFIAAPPDIPLETGARIVCVGRLCEQKGQLLLVDAVRRLRERGQAVALVLAGDGDMRPAIEDFIRQHKLEQQVTITGWVNSERVREEILAARLMVLASFAEGLPVVIMEAMALGRPVLTTAIAGIPELVRHEQDGWLVPAGDVETLANTLAIALATPNEQLQRMGQSARSRVLARHSVDIEASKLRSIFESDTIT